jgi:hypothetical protein
MFAKEVGRLFKSATSASRVSGRAMALLSLASLFIVVTATYAFQTTPDVGPFTVIGKGTRDHDVVVYVSMRETSSVGEKLTLWLSAENEGKNQSEVETVKGMFPDCKFKAVDRINGTEPRRTAFGSNFLNRFPDTSRSREVLHYGMRMHVWTLDLAQCYQFTPGEYKLTLTLPINPSDPKKTFDITISDVSFRITD